MKDIHPPHVAVIDLDEVLRKPVEWRYAVLPDFDGLLVMMLFLKTIITLLLHAFDRRQSSWQLAWRVDVLLVR